MPEREAVPLGLQGQQLEQSQYQVQVQFWFLTKSFVQALDLSGLYSRTYCLVASLVWRILWSWKRQERRGSWSKGDFAMPSIFLFPFSESALLWWGRWSFYSNKEDKIARESVVLCLILRQPESATTYSAQESNQEILRLPTLLGAREQPRDPSTSVTKAKRSMGTKKACVWALKGFAPTSYVSRK